ncbi:MAG: hypothetical protein H6730_36455, partial [Deltaproteobacteria bacterium]|nr:hypothetical protein [Deltaproteobacteria bacterium]
MRRSISIALAALALGVSTQAQAQCLAAADEPAFIDTVRRNINRSDWGIEEVTLRAFDRLGYGQNPKQGNAYDPAQASKPQRLAELIA